jgi:hypothetical protein
MTFRESATPLTIGSFLLIAITGVLMFFHLDSGLNKLAHEWLGWAMIAAVGLHAIVHVKSFQRHFKRPAALALIGAFVVLLATSFISPGGKADKPPHVLAAQAVLDAPLENVAALAHKDTQTLLAELQAAGFAADSGRSLHDSIGNDRKQQMRALGIVFAAPR